MFVHSRDSDRGITGLTVGYNESWLRVSDLALPAYVQPFPQTTQVEPIQLLGVPGTDTPWAYSRVGGTTAL